MKRVAQIIPYFGKWPEWMPLYLYSCSRNPMIDFIFYTDCPTSQFRSYDNIHFIKTTFTDYCSLVGQRLNIDYKISNPYKLTDLKPFLGAVHREELRGYEFWSFGDIDLCYGDLSMVINDKNLSKYDLLTTHCYHIAGHLTVIKNNDFYRNLCFKIDNWAKKLTDDKHYALDENEWSKIVYPSLYIGRLLWKFLIRKLKITDFYTYLNKYNFIFNKKQLFCEYFTSPAPQLGEKWIYNLNAGVVTDNYNRNLPYIHFLFFKKTPWLKTDIFWNKDFYQLNDKIEKYTAIEISLDGIKPHKENE